LEGLQTHGVDCSQGKGTKGGGELPGSKKRKDQDQRRKKQKKSRVLPPQLQFDVKLVGVVNGAVRAEGKSKPPNGNVEARTSLEESSTMFRVQISTDCLGLEDLGGGDCFESRRPPRPRSGIVTSERIDLDDRVTGRGAAARSSGRRDRTLTRASVSHQRAHLQQGWGCSSSGQQTEMTRTTNGDSVGTCVLSRPILQLPFTAIPATCDREFVLSQGLLGDLTRIWDLSFLVAMVESSATYGVLCNYTKSQSATLP
jgi:hypothetical protein